MKRIVQVLSLVLLLAVSAEAKTIAIKAGLLIANARKAPIPNAVLLAALRRLRIRFRPVVQDGTGT
jgi:hypothetical protein